MMLKRLFDLCSSGVGLLFLSPLFAVIALIIKWDSAGEVFFRQVRVGLYGKKFRIYKFRTMVAHAEHLGAQITVDHDMRITRVGHWLRQYKLDELPQLINVFIGEMSLVGPRPEVPRYVAFYPEHVRDQILSLRPGITDPASIEFKSEGKILAQYDNPHTAYIEEILPVKLKHYTAYVEEQSLYRDMMIILNTLKAIWTKDKEN